MVKKVFDKITVWFSNLAIKIPRKDSNIFVLKKSKKPYYNLIDCFRFITKHLILIFVFCICGFGISFGLSDYIAPQTYYAISYLSVNETVNVSVYQAASDLMTSDAIINQTVEDINNNYSEDISSNVTAKIISNGLSIEISDEHYRIGVTFESSIKNIVLPVLTTIFEVYENEVQLNQTNYSDLYNYVFIQEEANQISESISKTPFIIFCGTGFFIIIGILISFLIEKKEKLFFTESQLVIFSDVLCVKKRKRETDFDEKTKKIGFEKFLVTYLNEMQNSKIILCYFELGKNEQEITENIVSSFSKEIKERIFFADYLSSISKVLLNENASLLLVCDIKLLVKKDIKNLSSANPIDGIIIYE